MTRRRSPYHWLPAALVAPGLVLLPAAPAPAGEAAPPPQTEAGPSRSTGELLVQFRDGLARSSRAAIRAAAGTELVRTTGVRGLEVVRPGRGRTSDAALAALLGKAGVRFAEPNLLYQPTATPNDPSFSQLWGLHNTGQTGGTADADIDAPEAWELTTGEDEVTVAVVDTGIAYDHPDLASNVWTNPGESGGGRESNGLDDDDNGYVDDHRGWAFDTGHNDPYDTHGHGTHVAGTIGAVGDNAAAVAGVGWHTKVMALKVGNSSFSTAAIAEAIDYAGAMGARVVNGSFGGGFSQTMLDAVSRWPGMLFAFAAGNSATNNDIAPMYPCSHPSVNIVCVAATDHNDAMSSFSSYGASTVDLGAPGSSILSTVPGPLAAPLYTDDFESDLAGRWVTGGTTPWQRTTTASVSPSHSITDSVAGPYLSPSESWIRTASPVDLSGKHGCRASFGLKLDTEDWYDFLHLEAARSADGPWSGLAQWTGSSNGAFLTRTTMLGGFDGASAVYLRFRLSADPIVNDDGAYVDDFNVRCLAAPTASDLALYWGTSMATPHVAGAAALVWSRFPTATMAHVRGSMLASVDPNAALAGKTTTGGRLNMRGALDAAEDGDVTAPSNPTVTGDGHTAGEWTSAAAVTVRWSGAQDAQMGVDGYSFAWDSAASSVPPTTKTAEETASADEETLPEGTHYFHLRTVDNAGNWSDPVHHGPVLVDTTSPNAPVIESPAEGAVLGSQATVTGTAEPGTQVRILDGGAQIGAGTASAGTGAFSVQVGFAVPGHRVLSATALDAASNPSPASAPRTVTVAATPPGVTLAASPAPFTTGRAVAVQWGSAAPLSGLVSYDVRYRAAPHDGDFGEPVAWREDAGATSGVLEGDPGTTYCFSVRANNEAGEASAWSAESCTAVPLGNAALEHGKGWKKKQGSGHYLDSFSRSRLRGSRLSLAGVRAKRISIVVTRCSRCGTIKVRWNGKLLKTIGLSASSMRKRQVVNLASFPELRTGTITVKVASSDRVVRVEGLGVSAV